MNLLRSPVPTKPILAAVALSLASLSMPVSAVILTKPDDVWRYELGAGWSRSTGNSDTSLIRLTAEAARQSLVDKWSLSARQLYQVSNGSNNGDQTMFMTNYDRELRANWYLFGNLDYLRDRPANVAQRFSAYAGPGYHVIKSDTAKFDVFAGVGYRRDIYIQAARVGNAERSTYGVPEMQIGEQSEHKITDTTTFHQRLVFYPNLSDRGQYRAIFDSGLTVAITKSLGLTATFVARHNTDPGEQYKRRDSLFVTGLTYKIQ